MFEIYLRSRQGGRVLDPLAIASFRRIEDSLLAGADGKYAAISPPSYTERKTLEPSAREKDAIGRAPFSEPEVALKQRQSDGEDFENKEA